MNQAKTINIFKCILILINQILIPQNIKCRSLYKFTLLPSFIFLLVGWMILTCKTEHFIMKPKLLDIPLVRGAGETLNTECTCTHTTFTQYACPSLRSSTVFLNWVSRKHLGWQKLNYERNMVCLGQDFSDSRHLRISGHILRRLKVL